MSRDKGGQAARFFRQVELNKRLMWAVIEGEHDDALCSIREGAQADKHEINPVSQQYESMLFVALRRADSKMIDLLCKEAGLRPNDSSHMEMAITPLFVVTQMLITALQAKQVAHAKALLSCFDVLLQYGADIDKPSPLFGSTVWDLLAESGVDDGQPLHRYFRFVTADVTAVDALAARAEVIERIDMTASEHSIYAALVASTVSTLFDDTPVKACEADSPPVKGPRAACRG